MINKKIQKFMSLLMVISFGIPFLIFPLFQGIIQILNDRENVSLILFNVRSPR